MTIPDRDAARKALAECADAIDVAREDLHAVLMKHGDALVEGARKEIVIRLGSIESAALAVACIAEDDDSYEPDDSGEASSEDT